MKVLVLSCNMGQGHNTAAKAIKEEWERRGVTCDMKDALSFGGEQQKRLRRSRLSAPVWRKCTCINLAEKRIRLRLFLQPRTPRWKPKFRMLLHSGGTECAESSLVHQRQQRHRGLIGIAATGIGIDMLQKIACECQKIGIRPFMDVKQGFDLLV